MGAENLVHESCRLLVTPDTILRWHRNIVRRRCVVRSMRAKTGPSATRRKIGALILRLARENPNGDTAGSTAAATNGPPST